MAELARETGSEAIFSENEGFEPDGLPKNPLRGFCKAVFSAK
jgi:hypothetical protein